MSDAAADRCWAMLALGAPDSGGLDLSPSRISSFISRDKSPEKVRSSLLVGALVGLGRINAATADSLSRRYSLGVGRQSEWTRVIDGAAARGQGGTVLVLAGTGLQTSDWAQVPGSHLFHIVAALVRTRQDYFARMIAAEALART
jgi:hypothetical protein